MTTATKKKTDLQYDHSEAICPVCDGSMCVVYESQEDGVLYQWNQCKRYNCDGQSLEKRDMPQ
jgi:hypothetical protein